MNTENKQTDFQEKFKQAKELIVKTAHQHFKEENIEYYLSIKNGTGYKYRPNEDEAEEEIEVKEYEGDKHEFIYFDSDYMLDEIDELLEQLGGE